MKSVESCGHSLAWWGHNITAKMWGQQCVERVSDHGLFACDSEADHVTTTRRQNIRRKQSDNGRTSSTVSAGDGCAGCTLPRYQRRRPRYPNCWWALSPSPLNIIQLPATMPTATHFLVAVICYPVFCVATVSTVSTDSVMVKALDLW